VNGAFVQKQHFSFPDREVADPRYLEPGGHIFDDRLVWQVTLWADFDSVTASEMSHRMVSVCV
jgi:hypothetical protein